MRLPNAYKMIPVTRGGPVRGGSSSVDNRIPSQSSTAVVAFQLRVAVPRRVSFSPQRTSQSATSPVFVVGSGTTAPFRHSTACPETSSNSRPETKRSANSIAAALAAMPHRMDRPDVGVLISSISVDLLFYRQEMGLSRSRRQWFRSLRYRPKDRRFDAWSGLCTRLATARGGGEDEECALGVPLACGFERVGSTHMEYMIHDVLAVVK